jgi:hypothetical protein
VRRRAAGGVLAALSCAAVLTLSACDTTSEAPAEGGHGGGHEGGHSGSHPTSHHTPAPPTGEYDPSRCPTGLVC